MRGPAAPDPVVVRGPLRLEQPGDPEAGAGQQRDPVAERAVVLDVGHDAGGVVDLDVRRPVPVGLAGRQAGLAGVVGEHPPGRVGDREREPAAGAQHPGRLGDRQVDVGDELQRAEGARRRRRRSRRRTAGGWRCRAPPAPRCRSGRRSGASAAAGGADRSSPTARPPWARTQREHCPAPDPTSSTSRPATSPSTRADSSVSPSGPQTKPASPRNPPWVAWYSSAYRSQSGPLADRDSCSSTGRRSTRTAGCGHASSTG